MQVFNIYSLEKDSHQKKLEIKNKTVNQIKNQEEFNTNRNK